MRTLSGAIIILAACVLATTWISYRGIPVGTIGAGLVGLFGFVLLLVGLSTEVPPKNPK
jgi:hypothetical protein